jgi:hypothetical protein
MKVNRPEVEMTLAKGVDERPSASTMLLVARCQSSSQTQRFRPSIDLLYFLFRRDRSFSHRNKEQVLGFAASYLSNPQPPPQPGPPPTSSQARVGQSGSTATPRPAGAGETKAAETKGGKTKVGTMKAPKMKTETNTGATKPGATGAGGKVAPSTSTSETNLEPANVKGEQPVRKQKGKSGEATTVRKLPVCNLPSREDSLLALQKHRVSGVRPTLKELLRLLASQSRILRRVMLKLKSLPSHLLTLERLHPSPKRPKLDRHLHHLPLSLKVQCLLSHLLAVRRQNPSTARLKLKNALQNLLPSLTAESLLAGHRLNPSKKRLKLNNDLPSLLPNGRIKCRRDEVNLERVLHIPEVQGQRE